MTVEYPSRMRYKTIDAVELTMRNSSGEAVSGVIVQLETASSASRRCSGSSCHVAPHSAVRAGREGHGVRTHGVRLRRQAREHLMEERVVADEVYAELRKAGIEDLSQIKWALPETDRKISIVPAKQPAGCPASISAERSIPRSGPHNRRVTEAHSRPASHASLAAAWGYAPPIG